MRTHKEGKPQLTNMSSIEEQLCIFVKCGSVGLLGNGYAEIESKFWFSQKGLMVLQTLLHEEVASVMSSLHRLKVSDQKIE